MDCARSPRKSQVLKKVVSVALPSVPELILYPLLGFGCRIAGDAISHRKWPVTHLLPLPTV